MALRGIHARRPARFAVFLTLALSFPAFAGWDIWKENPSAKSSLTIKPVREIVQNGGDRWPEGLYRELELVYKRYPRKGGQPVLLLPGIASNDRVWDAAVPEFSFARYLHAKGYDVWVANYRHSGTEGFRSESPAMPYHWTVEDLAIYDLPALIERVRWSTGQRPFVLGHSLSAWILEGYLAGLQYDADGHPRPNPTLARTRQAGLKGVVTVAGVYNTWWPKSLRNALTDPVLSWDDFYQSNYELEAMAANTALYEIAEHLPTAPLSWIGDVLGAPLENVPVVGSALAAIYRKFQEAVIGTPVLAMFYYPNNTDREVVRTHGLDGLEEFGPRLLIQLANSVNNRATMAYYHGAKPKDVYAYASVRRKVEVPMLFVAGAKDRLANSEMIYRDGYLATQARDKEFILTEAGHLDVIAGRNAEANVLEPLVEWMRARD